MGKGKEPKWHHSLKRFRQTARERLRASGKAQPRYKDLVVISSHHGSQLPQKARLSYLKRIAMASWQCRFCLVWAQIEVTHCTACHRHWRQAQRLRSSSRAQNRSQGRKKEQGKAKEVQDEKVTEETDIFRSVPWIASLVLQQWRIPPAMRKSPKTYHCPNHLFRTAQRSRREVKQSNDRWRRFGRQWLEKISPKRCSQLSQYWRKKQACRQVGRGR